MSPWESVLHQVGLIIAALLSIVLAFVGDLTRLYHEQEHGGAKVTLASIPGSLLRAMLMGVIASATSIYLRDNYGLPELAGGALGGILGYLGPSLIGFGFKAFMDRYAAAKPKGPKDDA